MELTYEGGAAAVLVDGVGRVERGKTVKVTDQAQCKRLLASSNWQRAKQTQTQEKPADPPKAVPTKETD